jgi:hypothetical protein
MFRCIQSWAGRRAHRGWYYCAGMVDGGSGWALVVFTHAAAIFVIGGAFDMKLYNMIETLSCRRITLHLCI